MALQRVASDGEYAKRKVAWPGRLAPYLGGVTTTVRIVTEGMVDPLKGGRGPWAVPGLENGTRVGSVLQDRRGGQGQRRIGTGPQGAGESMSLCARV
jgi:hypothetical protein